MTETAIRKFCDDLAERIIDKNRKYGDSLQNPRIQISRIQNSEKILSRIEDKINRFASVGFTEDTEDSLEDLVGYYVHYKISKKNEQEGSDN